MRLILKLKSLNEASQEYTNSKFFSAMHGWIYKKIQVMGLLDIYKSKLYKPFCFSNIYPIKDNKIEYNKEYNIIISSPIPKFIEFFFFNINNNEKINLGELSFKVKSKKIIRDIKISSFSTIESATIITTTIKKGNKIISLDFENDKEFFLKQLSKNLIKKYNFFNKSNIDININLFKDIDVESFLRKKYAIPIITHNQNKFLVIGNKLRFKFKKIDSLQKEILNYAFDLGFGEKNTYGMGFMIKRF